MHFAITIRNMNVSHATPQLLNQGRRLLGEDQMRDVEVGLHRRMIDVRQKPPHALHVIEQRQVERLEFQGNLDPEVRGMFPQHPDVGNARGPLFRGRNHLTLPDIFTQHEQRFFASNSRTMSR